ncbi:MAG: nucleoside triphosphate pyrophosphohydrolase family protein [Patescibacteria group bacterium]
MNFEEYQKIVKKTSIYPNQGNNVAYATLGLAGEAGEVADKVKKLIRDFNGVLTEDKRKEMIKELGDVLWYLTACASELGVDLEEVAAQNAKKVEDRRVRGVISGEGDNR